MIEIKSWITSQLIYKSDLPSLKDAVLQAVREGANLYGADLYGANLYGANLRGADLRGANLYGADLYGANLYGANLRGANLSGANLSGANLYGANLRGANLYGANLYGANLYGANLRGANLRGANLRGANLYGTDLRGANLRGAEGMHPEESTPLLMLLDQPGKIRAYKVVNEKNEGHINGGIKYQIGECVEVGDACTDVNQQCGKGIHVATLDWCLKEFGDGHRILILEFEAKDIAAIPTATDGKFRLHRALVVGEKDVSKLVRAQDGAE